MLEHHDRILSLLEEGYNVDTIYLDITKAFDKVDINLLLNKIKAVGINGKLYQWIQGFLTNREQLVLVNGKKSYTKKVISGVPQGSVCGPLFFLIMIADIDKDVKHAFLSSFADDTRMSKEVLLSEDTSLLQEDLDTVYKWASSNNFQQHLN